MSKYDEVASDLAAKIENGQFSHNEKLPTEDELMQMYQVSRNTIRSAIQKLIRQGHVYSRQGSGNFARCKMDPTSISVTGTMGLQKSFPDSKFETKVRRVQVIHAGENLSRKMLCPVGTPIYYVERVRIIDGKKFALEYTYYNKNIVPYLSEEIAGRSIYSYLRDDLQLRFGFADKNIRAVKLNKDQAACLDLRDGDPALVVSDSVFLENGELFNFSHMIYNYKYANFYAASNT